MWYVTCHKSRPSEYLVSLPDVCRVDFCVVLESERFRLDWERGRLSCLSVVGGYKSEVVTRQASHLVDRWSPFNLWNPREVESSGSSKGVSLWIRPNLNGMDRRIEVGQGTKSRMSYGLYVHTFRYVTSIGSLGEVSFPKHPYPRTSTLGTQHSNIVYNVICNC